MYQQSHKPIKNGPEIFSHILAKFENHEIHNKNNVMSRITDIFVQEICRRSLSAVFLVIANTKIAVRLEQSISNKTQINPPSIDCLVCSTFSIVDIQISTDFSQHFAIFIGHISTYLLRCIKQYVPLIFQESFQTFLCR